MTLTHPPYLIKQSGMIRIYAESVLSPPWINTSPVIVVHGRRIDHNVCDDQATQGINVVSMDSHFLQVQYIRVLPETGGQDIFQSNFVEANSRN